MQGLEARIHILEEQLASALEVSRNHTVVSEPSVDNGHSRIHTTESPAYVNETHAGGFSPLSYRSQGQVHSPSEQAPTTSMARELRILSLEAAAERHLGSSSGLSFAKLTQTVLKRLTPDRADFVFGISQGDDILGEIDWDSTPDFSHPHVMNFPNIAGFGPTLFGKMSLSNIIEPSGSLADLSLPTKSRADQLTSFYFAHSHTLYPILNQRDFLALLDRIYEQPSDNSIMDSLSWFRVWMVLAIGSSARCSVSMVEESEALLYYNKALEFFESAFDHGDMVSSVAPGSYNVVANTAFRSHWKLSCFRCPFLSSTSSDQVNYPCKLLLRNAILTISQTLGSWLVPLLVWL